MFEQFEQLLKVKADKIGNETLANTVRQLVDEYNSASSKEAVVEILGPRATQAYNLVASKFPEAIGDAGAKPKPTLEVVQRNMPASKEKSIVKAAQKAKAYNSVNSDVIDLRDSYGMYNADISEEERDAYLIAHPEDVLNYIFKPKYDAAELVQKGLLFYSAGKLHYRYEYLSGDISTKLKLIEQLGEESLPDAEHIKAQYGVQVLQRQIDALLEVRPMNKKIRTNDENNRIILEAFSQLVKTVKISELSPASGVNLTRPESISEAFRFWLLFGRHSESYSDRQDISEMYIDAKPARLSESERKDLTRAQEEQQKAQQKEKYMGLGRRKFREFLELCLTANDAAALEGLWNSQFNAVVEPDYNKIPVAFRQSEFVKKNTRFRLGKAQRNGIAYKKVKGSACLGYGVGVGKTFAALCAISESFDNNQASRALLVVPDATYKKWIYEIAGGQDGKSGVFLKGALPHVTLLPWGNLSRDIIRNEVKAYSEEEEYFLKQYESFFRTFASLKKEALVYAKNNDFIKLVSALNQVDEAQANLAENIMAFKISDKIDTLITKMQLQKGEELVSIGGTTTVVSAKLEIENTTFSEAQIKYLDNGLSEVLASISFIYEELVMNFGRVREVPANSIVLVNYHGAKQIGVNADTAEKLSGIVYKILSQGRELGVTDTEELSALEGTIAKAMGKTGAAKIMKLEAERQKKAEEMVGGVVVDSKILIEDIGIDFLCMDEAHNAKKVFTRVAGAVIEGGKRDRVQYAIDGGEPSDLGIQMFLLSQYVQQLTNGKNVLMLTATPFTNSPLEIFSILALSNYKKLEEVGQSSLLEFFNTYIREERQLVVTASGGVKIEPTITSFNNLAQLKQLVFYSIDYKTGEDAGVIRPALITFSNKITLNEGGDFTELSKGSSIVKMSPLQERYAAEIVEYIEGKKSIDALCADASASAEDGAACSLTVEYLANLAKSAEKRPKDGESEGVRILRGLSLGRLNAISPYLYGCNEFSCPTAVDFVEDSAKIKYVMECIRSVKKWHEAKGEAVSGQVIYSSLGIRYFFLMKQYLVEKVGFKPEEVGIIAATYFDGKKEKALSKAEKEAIKEGFLRGDVKVVIGSPSIKEGVDLQNRSTVLYNLSPDWNPTDYQQIIGRIWRQGNIYPYVRIVNVLAADSADIFMQQKLEEKTLRIKKLLDKDDKTSSLSLEEFNPAEMKLALIRDPKVKASISILLDKQKLQGVLDEEVINLRKLQEIDTEAIKRYATVNPIYLAEANKLSQLVADFRLWAAQEDEREKWEAKQAKKEVKESLVTKIDPSSDEFKAKEILDDANVNRNIANLMRVARNNEYYDGFKAFDFYKFNNIQSEWIKLRASKNATTDLLTSMGISLEEASNAIKLQQEKIEGIQMEIANLEQSKEAREKQYLEESQKAENQMKTVAEQVAVFEELNHYLGYRVAPEAEKVVTEAPQEPQSKSAYYAEIIEGYKTLMELSDDAEKAAYYAEIIDGYLALSDIQFNADFEYPSEIDSDGKKALYDVLKNAPLSISIHNTVNREKDDDWRFNLIKKRKVKNAIIYALNEYGVKYPVDELYNIISINKEY